MVTHWGQEISIYEKPKNGIGKHIHPGTVLGAFLQSKKKTTSISGNPLTGKHSERLLVAPRVQSLYLINKTINLNASHLLGIFFTANQPKKSVDVRGISDSKICFQQVCIPKMENSFSIESVQSQKMDDV